LALISALGTTALGKEPAGDSAPGSASAIPSPEDARAACLAAHEQSQVLRMDAKLLEARPVLRQCADAACPAVIRVDCTKWLNELEQSVPTIVIVARSEQGDATDVNVFLDGRPWINHLDGKPVELDPGAHQLRFEHASRPPLEMRVVIGQGEKNRVVAVDFSPKPPATVPAPATPPLSLAPAAEAFSYRPVPWTVYLLGGVTAVAITASLWAGISARLDRDRAKESCAPLCPDERVSDIHRKALFADIAWATALVSAGSALVLYWTRPVRQRPLGQTAVAGVDLAPLPNGGIAGMLRLQGAFP
jgi:hypothetical protein